MEEAVDLQKVISKYHPELASRLAIEKSSFLLAEKESQEVVSNWFHEFAKDNLDVLFIMGLGYGEVFFVAQEWLRENPLRKLVFVEENVAAIASFLNLPEAKAIVTHPQVVLLDSAGRFEDLLELNKLLWSLHSLEDPKKVIRALVTSTPTFFLKKVVLVTMLQQMVLSLLEEQQMLHYELLEMHSLRYTNYYHNVLKGSSFFDKEGLKGVLKGKTALICGAGPSLLSQEEKIKSLRDRVVIFAGGTAIAVLAKMGIVPDVLVGTDPHLIHFSKVIHADMYEVPYFCTFRVNYLLPEYLSAPVISLQPTCQGCEYFEPLYRGEEEILSVTHQALVLAAFLGCQKAYLVGLDLSYEQGEIYPFKDLSHPAFPEKIFEKDLLCPARDKEGRIVQTTRRFLKEAKGFMKLIASCPEMEVIDATPRGLAIQGCARGSLENLPLGGGGEVLPAILSCAKPLLKETEGLNIVEKWHKSLINSRQKLRKLVSLLEQEAHSPSKNFKNTFALLEDDFFEEEVYKILLVPIETMVDSIVVGQAKFWEKKEKKDEEIAFKRYHFLEGFLKSACDCVEEVLSCRFKEIPMQSFKACTLGKREGQKLKYYKDGSLYADELYKGEKREGVSRYFYPSGQLRSELSYKEGILHGPVILYHPNGKVKRQILYVEGKKEGKETFFYSNGALFLETFWEEGIVKKEACSFYPNGEEKTIAHYTGDGKLIRYEKFNFKSNSSDFLLEV